MTHNIGDISNYKHNKFMQLMISMLVNEFKSWEKYANGIKKIDLR